MQLVIIKVMNLIVFSWKMIDLSIDLVRDTFCSYSVMELCTKGLSTSIVDLKVCTDLLALMKIFSMSIYRIAVYPYHVFEHVLLLPKNDLVYNY